MSGTECSSWEVLSETPIADGHMKLLLGGPNGERGEVYTKRYHMPQKSAGLSVVAYRVKLAFLHDEILPVFGLRRSGAYRKDNMIYLCIAGDPKTTEIRDDARLAEKGARKLPEENLKRLSVYLLLRWGLGLHSSIGKLRWRDFSGFPRYPGTETVEDGGAGTLVLTSETMAANPNAMGEGKMSMALEQVIGDYGRLVCESFNIDSMKALTNWSVGARTACREKARSIDEALVSTVDGMFSAFVDEARIYLADRS